MLYECRPEFRIAAAFKADSARKKIALSADIKPPAILLTCAFFLFGEPVDVFFYDFVSILSAAFKKKTAFANVFHILNE